MALPLAGSLPTSSKEFSIILRLLLPVLLILAEVIGASIAFDTKSLEGRGPLLAFAGAWAPAAVRFCLLMSAGLAVFGVAVWKPMANRFRNEIAATPIRWRWLLIHAGTVALLAPSASALFWGGAAHGVIPWLLAATCLLTAIAAAGAILWTLPFSALALAARTLGAGWALAGLVAMAATFGSTLAQALWRPSASLTFRVVEILLQPLLPHFMSDSSRLLIGSDSFYVEIAPACSGYEGVAMALVFSASWLWYFRHEYRFPNALILVPAAAAAMWILNSLRIAALILIGHAGAPGVAMGGFHSQAGWLAFITVAIGLCILSRRLPLIAATPAPGARGDSLIEAQPVAAYLMPFLAILAATMISRAASSTFEWLYPLRIAAAAAAIWYYRRQYVPVSWQVGPLAAATGIAVFALWIAFDRSPATPMNPEIAAMPTASRAFWIAMRVIGAVITVPIAEELAFRGFLMRRLAAENFSAVSWRAFSWMPFLVSSVAFGALHGGRWLEGTLAGMAYALVMIRNGRLGDAVAAHAITNVLLAALVIIGGQWQYW